MANPQVLLYELNVDWRKEIAEAKRRHYRPPLPDFGGHGRDNQPGDDMLGAGAVKTNPTDRFNSSSPEKIPDGDNAGML
ncbi:unnamed protein product [Brassica rapa]|uniref:Uncharacterized protein n=1 Tax=Brassica campestris TaxID=3711 RepID=M4ECQ0_BRACM|nr:unnamed protein product [Brassica rapa]